MAYLPLAFLMGLLGSLHCAVMCGPIVLSLPLQKASRLYACLQLFLYQFGRISVYVLLGMLAGAFGNALKIFTSQKTVSMLTGVLLIGFALLQFNQAYKNKSGLFQLKLLKPVSRLMSKVFHLPLWGFFVGFLNGLIPCGMVYLALASALNTSSLQSAATFMLLFGLGTSPLMLFISLAGVYLKKYIRFNVQKIIPWFMLLMGVLLILRSADLGISFFSPQTIHPYGSALECQ